MLEVDVLLVHSSRIVGDSFVTIGVAETVICSCLLDIQLEQRTGSHCFRELTRGREVELRVSRNTIRDERVIVHAIVDMSDAFYNAATNLEVKLASLLDGACVRVLRGHRERDQRTDGNRRLENAFNIQFSYSLYVLIVTGLPGVARADLLEVPFQPEVEP